MIKLSNIAKYGDTEAYQVKPLSTDKYKKLIKESNDRIKEDTIRYANSYRRSMFYVATTYD